MTVAGRELDGQAIELTPPLPVALAGELRQRVLFAAAEIEDFELVVDGDQVTGVRVAAAETVDHGELTRKLNAVVDSDIRPQLTVPGRIVWTSPLPPAPARPELFAELEDAGLVVAAGAGQMALGGPLVQLLRALDDALTAALRKRFTVAEFRYPTLIPTRALERAGYFDSFPQHLMFVTRLHNDIDVYDGVRSALAGKAVDAQLLEYCRDLDHCLPPTMCYHTFEQYRGRTLGPGLQVVTARGKSFRFEAGYATSLERLWDFTIREIVFLGARDAVVEARQQYLAIAFDLVTELGLSGHCEVANDPFFGTASTSERIWSQRLMELKYELRLPVGAGHDIAVGSFNLHNDLFGGRFDIRQADGEVVSSACVGFGLERLVYAFLSRHGADPAGWPTTLPG